MGQWRLQQIRSPRVFSVVVVVSLLAALWATGTAGARSPVGSPLQTGVPPVLNYQGIVKVAGEPYDGTGYFKFAIVDAASGEGTVNYWANDGTASGQPAASVALAVSGGLFSVLLGDTGLPGMSQDINETALAGDPSYLRVWFSKTGADDAFAALGQVVHDVLAHGGAVAREKVPAVHVDRHVGDVAALEMGPHG